MTYCAQAENLSIQNNYQQLILKSTDNLIWTKNNAKLSTIICTISAVAANTFEFNATLPTICAITFAITWGISHEFSSIFEEAACDIIEGLKKNVNIEITE